MGIGCSCCPWCRPMGPMPDDERGFGAGRANIAGAGAGWARLGGGWGWLAAGFDAPPRSAGGAPAF